MKAAAPIATLRTAPARRIFALCILMLLGFLLLYMGLFRFSDVLNTVFYVVFGGTVLYAARIMHRARDMEIILNKGGLFLSNGQAIAPVDEIAHVNRGIFAAKPAGGFAVIVHKRQPFVWMPGLYWQMGRRIGIGGMTSRVETKHMADQLSTIMAAGKK